MLLLNKLNQSVRGLAIVVLALSVVSAAPALAGTVYSWETEDGTSSFTDDPKRIPAKYKSTARSRQMKKLDDYPRLTPGPKHEEAGYYDRLERRLGSLRTAPQAGAPATAAMPAMAPTGPQQVLRVRTGRNIETAIPLSTMSTEPVVTESLRVYSNRSNQTYHVTVTRQGDRVLSIVRPNDMPMEIGLDEKRVTGMRARRY